MHLCISQVIPKLKLGTTTRGPFLPRTFVLPIGNDYELTTSKIVPVGLEDQVTTGVPVLLDYNNEVIPTLPPHLHRELRTDDMFKNFLSTMFESHQVEDYLDEVLNKNDDEKENENSESATEFSSVRKPAKQLKRKPIERINKIMKMNKQTTKDDVDTYEESKQVTVMDMKQFNLGELDDMQDALLKSHKQPNEENKFYHPKLPKPPKPPKSPKPSKTTKAPKSTNAYKTSKSSKPHKSHHRVSSDEDDKKVEEVIVSLIDHLDVQNILQSKSIESIVSTSQEDSQEGSKENMIDVLRNQEAMKEAEEKRKLDKYQEESVMSPKLDQATIKEIAKVMNMDESVLTFLYLNNMKNKQNETLKKKEIAPARFKITHKRQDLYREQTNEEEPVESNIGGEELGNDEEYDSDDDDDSEDEYKALSIQVNQDEATPDKHNSKDTLDVEDIYQKLLDLVRKEKLKEA